MFFEDEKDTNNNTPNNSVGWDDVLNDNGNALQGASFNDDDVLGKISSIDSDFDDEINLDSNNLDEDEELEKILKQDENRPKQKAFDAFGSVAASRQADRDDDIDSIYDIDEQLAGVIGEDDVVHKVNSEPGPILKQKPVSRNIEEVKKQFRVSPKIFLLLVIVIACFAYYVFSQYGKENNIIGNLIPNFGKSNVEVDDIASVETQEEIPVLSENDISSPDAAALLGIEKKQTVDVQSTGRNNPFLPDKKYISSAASYASSGILMPPDEYGELTDATDKMLSIAVSGIMYDPQKPSAIILYDGNDYFVQKGDKLNDYKVLDISKNYVAIGLGKNVYKARVGEEFKVTSNFYGSAQYGQGGGRQYYSVDMNKDSENGYVSERDVEIRSK